MGKKQYFKGSIVIGDPSYFVNSESDWELCEFGKRLDELGFSDYLFIEFPDDPQIVINEKTREILGGICQDSGIISIVYKKELESYNPDYEKSFFSKNNRTIINDFEGEIEYRTVPLDINGYSDTDTVITGNGNITFKSCYEEDVK